MVNAPSLNPSTGSSMIELFAVVLLVAGIAIAVSAVPAFRSKAAEHAAQLRAIVDPNAPKPTSVTTPASKAAGSPDHTTPTPDPVRRREIDDFDYSLFDR